MGLKLVSVDPCVADQSICAYHEERERGLKVGHLQGARTAR
jgi:hypothetical protein